MPIKPGFEDVVNAANDVFDNRFGREINAAPFPQFWVVGAEEGLVKMHHRVSLLGSPAEVGEDAVDISMAQDLDQILDHPCQSAAQIKPAVIKQVAQLKGLVRGISSVAPRRLKSLQDRIIHRRLQTSHRQAFGHTYRQI